MNNKKSVAKGVKLLLVALCMAMAFMSAQPQVNVLAKSKSKVVLNKKKVILKVGKRVQLKLTKSGKKVKKVKWKSSNKKIAKVFANGRVKAVKKGKTTITAKVGKKKYKCKVTVKKAQSATKVTNVKSDIDSNTLSQSIYLLDKLYEGSNIIVSPTSLNMAIGMVANGTINEAKSGCEKYLGATIDKYNDSALAIMNRAKTDTMLKVTNGIWYRNGLTLNDTFKTNVVKYYNSSVKASDLDNNTVTEINNWASDNTDGMIKKIIEDIPSDTTALLCNALLFDGKWTKAFKKEDTQDEYFTKINGDKIKVKMMNATVSYYYENKYAIGFEKTYGKNGEYSFIAVLPKKNGEFKFSDLNLNGFLGSKTSDYTVNIKVPKFTYDCCESLKDVLCSTSLSPIFNKNTNPLGGMFNNNPGIPTYVSNVTQACKIIVDEEGTKAAAVTTTYVTAASYTAGSKNKNVYLNRSFGYLIVDNSTKQVMFSGKVIMPKQ